MKLKQQVSSLRLIPSSGGVFEVTVNGETIHSKLATGQFPDFDAVVKQVRDRR